MLAWTWRLSTTVNDYITHQLFITNLLSLPRNNSRMCKYVCIRKCTTFIRVSSDINFGKLAKLSPTQNFPAVEMIRIVFGMLKFSKNGQMPLVWDHYGTNGQQLDFVIMDIIWMFLYLFSLLNFSDKLVFIILFFFLRISIGQNHGVRWKMLTYSLRRELTLMFSLNL